MFYIRKFIVLYAPVWRLKKVDLLRIYILELLHGRFNKINGEVLQEED